MGKVSTSRELDFVTLLEYKDFYNQVIKNGINYTKTLVYTEKISQEEGAIVIKALVEVKDELERNAFPYIGMPYSKGIKKRVVEKIGPVLGGQLIFE